MQELLLKFLKFGVVGASGVGVDFGITWLCRQPLKLNQYLANSLGFSFAVVSNFLLNRIWTFHSQDPAVGTQFTKFAVIAVMGLGLNNGIIYYLNERRGINFWWAKLIATGIVMIWNFWANLTFTFAGHA